MIIYPEYQNKIRISNNSNCQFAALGNLQHVVMECVTHLLFHALLKLFKSFHLLFLCLFLFFFASNICVTSLCIRGILSSPHHINCVSSIICSTTSLEFKFSLNVNICNPIHSCFIFQFSYKFHFYNCNLSFLFIDRCPCSNTLYNCCCYFPKYFNSASPILQKGIFMPLHHLPSAVILSYCVFYRFIFC